AVTSCSPNKRPLGSALRDGRVAVCSSGVVASDCNGPVVVTQTPAAGTSLGLGVTTITLHVKDAANNESTCTATFTVTDNTPPTKTGRAPYRRTVANATGHALVTNITAGEV